MPQFGLAAEEVAKVNAMLLNEFLKEHQTVQELKKQVAELTVGLHKLSVRRCPTSKRGAA